VLVIFLMTMSDRNNRKGAKHFFTQFQRFQSIVLGCVDYGPMVRHSIVAVNASGRDNSPHRGRKGLGTRLNLQRPGSVAQICNPSYLGGRDQEDHGLLEAGPGKKLCKTLSQPMAGCGSACLSFSAIWESKIGGSRFRPAPGTKQDPISKATKQKRAGRVAHVVECLSTKLKAPSSAPVPPKPKATKQKNLSKACSL
jgi:hypothetical protein